MLRTDRGQEPSPRVLAIAPSRYGFGYVVFDGPSEAIDSGVRKRTGIQRTGIIQVVCLLKAWDPDTIVIENHRAPESRRRSVTRRFLSRVERHARRPSHDLNAVRRSQVEAYFARFGARKKEEIHRVIAGEIPELGVKWPGPRKWYDAEPYAAGFFDAAALGLTHYAQQNGFSD